MCFILVSIFVKISWDYTVLCTAHFMNYINLFTNECTAVFCMITAFPSLVNKSM
jgi:hypothetical protein